MGAERNGHSEQDPEHDGGGTQHRVLGRRICKIITWGADLGLGERLKFRWSGWCGMRWATLLSTVRKEVLDGGHPQAIVIYLQENDLPGEKGVRLLWAIKEDLNLLRWKLPGTHLFWSHWLERRVWRGPIDPAKVDLARRRAGKAVAKFTVQMGGQVIKHPAISFRRETVSAGWSTPV